jgi:hypothetical protein
MYVKNSKGDTVPHFIVWQALIWERFTLLSPFLIVLITLFFYGAGFRNWELFFDTVLVMFGIVMVVWWFWVVYTIASIAYMIEKSSGRLRDVLTDIQDMKEEIKTFDNPFKK